MSKLNTRLLLWLVVLLTAIPLTGVAQELSVNYKNRPLEEVIADLKQKTNYQFVYQKQIFEGTRPVTASFNQVSLAYILDRVLFNNGLDYEMVKQTVIIRKAGRENFKKVVSGRVTDETGAPLPGVNVRIKDTQAGVATGIDGEYSIPVEGKHPVIVFSFIGMLDKEVRITRETQIPVMVEMQENATIMEEVIVTGYQNIKRENEPDHPRGRFVPGQDPSAGGGRRTPDRRIDRDDQPLRHREYNGPERCFGRLYLRSPGFKRGDCDHHETGTVGKVVYRCQRRPVGQ